MQMIIYLGDHDFETLISFAWCWFEYEVFVYEQWAYRNST